MKITRASFWEKLYPADIISFFFWLCPQTNFWWNTKFRKPSASAFKQGEHLIWWTPSSYSRSPASDWEQLCIQHPLRCQLNWTILQCDVIPDGKTEWNVQFWHAIAQASELSFPVVFHTENYAVHSGNPTVSSVYLPTPRWHHLKAHPFLVIHSADEHRMTYSFSNTTSYSTFYAFFSSFRIPFWPVCLANSKWQQCFYPP